MTMPPSPARPGRPAHRAARTSPPTTSTTTTATDTAGTAAAGSTSASTRRRVPRLALVLAVVLALLAGACSSPADEEGGDASLGTAVSTPEREEFPDGTTVRVLAHDSFSVSEEVLEQFTAATNAEVEIVLGGDAVAMVNQAILTAGNPQGDVLFGIDDNLLARAAAASLFEPFQPQNIDEIPAEFTARAQGTVTPIDYGDVCINYDRAWFEERNLPVPTTFAQLVEPAYRDLLVVEDPSRSSPGLSFLLATIAAHGGADQAEGANWANYWGSLKDNGVKVVDSWETAYYTEFSGSSGNGPRPLVVSYASSPPAEVTDESIPVDQAPTGVIPSTCYRQVEYAGVLRGADEPEAAKRFVEFMLGTEFQSDVPLQMYVFPVNPRAELPSLFSKFVTPVPEPLVLPEAGVDANRERWVQQWSALFR
jgi:thiamine transport system substrate-binding protein